MKTLHAEVLAAHSVWANSFIAAFLALPSTESSGIRNLTVAACERLSSELILDGMVDHRVMIVAHMFAYSWQDSLLLLDRAVGLNAARA